MQLIFATLLRIHTIITNNYNVTYKIIVADAEISSGRTTDGR